LFLRRAHNLESIRAFVHEKLFLFSTRDIILFAKHLERFCCSMRSKTSLRDYLPRWPFPPDKEVGLKSEPCLKSLCRRAPPTYKLVLSWQEART